LVSDSHKIRVAAVQTDPRLMQVGENLDGILGAIKEAATNRAELMAFPECSLTGYIFNSREEALSSAETVPGSATEKIATLCKELKVYVVFGLLEREDDRLYNAAVFVGPEGIIGRYRKNHLPFLGVDRFVDSGDEPFQVYQTPVGNIGLFICYDIVFPESARVMTLLGADILVLPTNFPQVRRETLSTHVVSTRAIENRVHVVAADRVGSERGSVFAGLSKIVDAAGKTLSLASLDRKEIIYGEVSLSAARQKRLIITPGEYELDYIDDRRPALYGEITRPKPDSRNRKP